MKKLALMAFVSMMLATGVAAQPSGQAPSTAPADQAPSQGSVIPQLPANASPVAKQVTSTINNFLSTPGKALSGLGNALQGLLGGGQAANITEG